MGLDVVKLQIGSYHLACREALRFQRNSWICSRFLLVFTVYLQRSLLYWPFAFLYLQQQQVFICTII